MIISILQWNVWYKEDIEKVAAFLRELKPDIACLQELTIGYQGKHSNTIEYLAAELGNYHSHSVEIEFSDGDKWKQANAILSRFPLSDQASSWINEPRGSGGYDDEYRGLISAKVSIGDKQLRVATTHMSYTHAFQETERKRQETDKLTEYLSNFTGNIVFTGDLNAGPDSHTVREVSKLFRHIGPSFDAPTWTTKPFSYNGFEANSLGWRLDYAFATESIKIVSANIVQTDISDHLPILIEIEI